MEIQAFVLFTVQRQPVKVVRLTVLVAAANPCVGFGTDSANEQGALV